MSVTHRPHLGRDRRSKRRFRAAYVGLSVFCLSLLIAGLTVWRLEESRLRSLQERVKLNGDHYAGRLRHVIESSARLTHVPHMMLHLHHGSVEHFEETARYLLALYPTIRNINLAPGGVVTHVAPLEGNAQALGHDLLKNPNRRKEAELARDSGKLTIAGPFQLIQGGRGVAFRQPVYLPVLPNSPESDVSFWGFVLITFRFPDMLESVRMEQLSRLGYAWRLWRVHPDTGKRDVLTASLEPMPNEFQEFRIPVPNAVWTLDIAPIGGWRGSVNLAAHISLGFFLSLLLGVVAGSMVRLSQQKKSWNASPARII